jgi:hypothetical protein
MMSFARVRALVVVSALVVCAIILVTMAIVRDRQAGRARSTGCASDAVLANVTLPVPEDVKLNVYNATDKPRLATDVAADFTNRKFKVEKQGNDPLAKRVDAVAAVRFGPQTVGAAWLVRAYFLNEAKEEFDINRKDDVVDVVIGTRFKQLATTTEKNQALGQMGAPRAPAGTCAVEA